MLYVFFVNTGDMMTFDMNLALESVSSLKEAIASKINIPVDKQVLLINGGESLSGDAKVYSYNAAGTDTSPIYLFSKQALEAAFELARHEIPSEYLTDYDMKERLESCLSMESTLNTVVTRVELAKELHDIATQLVNICERVIHDQHLQHQGWRAVVANLEDITVSLTDGVNYLKTLFSQYFVKRENYVKLLEEFSEDLKLLSTIPILKKLLDDKDIYESSEPITLLQWISQKDTKCTLEQVLQQAQQSVEQFAEHALDEITQEAAEVIKHVNKPQAKEIGGLEERLYGLEKLMQQARRLAADQNDIWQTLYQNQQRVLNLRDPSILPDLCKNHEGQLELMGNHHQQLREIRRKCVNAKWELSKNLHARLTWIVFIEKKLMDAKEKVFIYGENLRRLKRHLEVIEQVHRAPKVYIESVIEVVRRREFSSSYSKWSRALAVHASSVYEDEISARQKFSEQYATHFLNSLFPGMKDSPPAFATEAPSEFDTNLPELADEDLTLLKNSLPDLATTMQIPSRVPFRYMILTNSSALEAKNSCSAKQTSSDDTEDTEEFENVSNEISKLNRASPTDSPLAIRKCTEVATLAADRTSPEEFVSTEYFMDDSISQARAAVAANVKCASTCTSLNFDELVKLIDSLRKELNDKDVQFSSSESELTVCRTRLKQWLDVLRKLFRSIQDYINAQRQSTLCVKGNVVEMKKELDTQLKDIEQTMEEKLEEKNQVITNLRVALQEKEEQLDSAKRDGKQSLWDMQCSFEEEKACIMAEAEKRREADIENLKQEYERKLKEAKHDYDIKLKEETESLRSRFKLVMTTSVTDRVPTPSSMEPELEDTALEKQVATLKAEVAQKADEIKQLRASMESHGIVTQEKCNLPSSSSNPSTLVARLNEIKVAVSKFKRNLQDEDELQAFEAQIEKLLSDDFEATQSVVITQPEPKEHVIRELEMALRDRNQQITKLRENLIEMSMNASTFANCDRIAVLSCEPGDIVLLCYDDRYDSHIVFSLLPTLHFLHRDSLDPLQLNSGPGEAPKSWALAEVTEKEFCQAKKARNRYNVPIHTRFYRVKAKPWHRANILMKKVTCLDTSSPEAGKKVSQPSMSASVVVPKVTSSSSGSSRRMLASCVEDSESYNLPLELQ